MSRIPTISFLVLLMLSSCFDYEEEESLVNYGNFDYDLSDVLQEDWGAHSGNHYNMDFTIIGETTRFEENTDVLGQTYYTLSDEIECYIFIELFSPGKEKFQTGVFNRLRGREWEDVENEFIFRRLLFGRSLEEAIGAESGTVSLSINSNGVYRIKMDVVLKDDRVLKGTYIGVPNYFDRK